MSGATAKAPEPAAAVEFRDVRKNYGDFEALRGVTLDVREGECLVVCGPSGSGKSTLIRCVNRIETHDDGVVRVLGLEVNDATAMQVRRRTGMVFQQFNLFPHLTVLDNCTLAPRLVHGMAEEEAREVARQHLARVHIEDQANKYPGQLSGGQQQRAAIARALCTSPQVLLFDEPTSALDPEMVKEVLDVLVGLAKEGRTMLCVTHEMDFARRVANRVAFMDAGEVVEVARPENFFDRASSERARQFLSQLQPAGAAS